MGMKGGRPRKATALKLLEGNPGERKLNLEAEAVFGDQSLVMPEIFENKKNKIAKETWLKYSKILLDARVLKDSDAICLESLALCYQHWKGAEALITRDGYLVTASTGWQTANPAINIANQMLKQIRGFLNELGLTPASRSRLQVEPKKSDSADALRDLIANANKRQ